jgi:hypothetical protein
MLLEFRRSASTFMQEGDPSAATIQMALEQLARTLGSRLTEVLLSPEACARVQARMHAKDLGRPQLVIRVTGKSLLDDRALALPWELLMPEPGRFAVRDGQLDLVREAVVPGAPVLQEPTEPLSVAVTIAAPSDQTALRYEDEAFRLHQSLATLGHRVAFADLGTTEDCVRLAERITPTVLHFSGHGLPGGLVFEDEEGFSRIVRIDDLVKDLNVKLVPSGQPRPFPRLFFLASCYGASGDPSGASFDASHESSGLGGTRDARHAELDASLGRGPSTAASLHRHGFVQVVGYFGPVSDPLCTRAEEVFYKALGGGKTTLQAAAEARATLGTPLSVDKSHFVAPLAWAQLALYHRGPDHPLCRPGKDTSSPVPGRFSRATVQVSGMPVLEHGFIGRRSLLHLIRQRVKKGQRLLVLQGLGGLGKTALASHLVSRVLASELARRTHPSLWGAGPAQSAPRSARPSRGARQDVRAR